MLIDLMLVFLGTVRPLCLHGECFCSSEMPVDISKGKVGGV